MFRRLFSFSFFILGFIFLFLFSYSIFQRVNPWGLEKGFESYAVSRSAEASLVPQRLLINSIGADLPVVPAKVQNNTFETTNNGISYLSTSAVPGQRGNTIFYGHNWNNVLGNLKKIKIGDSIKIYTSPTQFSEYTVEYTAQVTPDQVHILNQTEDSRITIYTCSGFLDTKRFVAVGTLVE